MPNDEHLKDVEAYYADMQRMEIRLNSPKNTIDDAILAYMTKEKIYKSIREMVKMRKELEDLLLRITEKSGDRGRLMATKAMRRFLEKSERRILTVKQLRAVNKLNKRQINRRLALYKTEIEAETSQLSNQLNIFFKNAQSAGRTKADTLKELIKAANDDAGLVKGFEKRMKRIAIDAARRESQARAMDEYRKVAKPNEKWQWITVSTSPCPDCQARAGVILSYEAWVQMGLPGTGRTVCDKSCRCQLMPESVAEEQFPDVKQFNWDKEKLVLTTAGEARRFGAKSNQP